MALPQIASFDWLYLPNIPLLFLFSFFIYFAMSASASERIAMEDDIDKMNNVKNLDEGNNTDNVDHLAIISVALPVLMTSIGSKPLKV